MTHEQMTHELTCDIACIHMCVLCVCVIASEKQCVCVHEREKVRASERERESVRARERERQTEREKEREDAGVRGDGGDSVSARVAVMASAVGMVLVGWSDGCVSSRFLTKPLCFLTKPLQAWSIDNFSLSAVTEDMVRLTLCYN